MEIELKYDLNTVVINVEDCDGVFQDDVLEGNRLGKYLVTECCCIKE